MSRLETKQWSTERLLSVVVLLSVAIGGLTGYGLGVTARYQGPQTRVFYMFNGSLPFNQTTFGIPHDTFAPDRLIVNRGDTVVIHYINIEDMKERHSFTMDDPYRVNQIVDQGQNATITLSASLPGVFRYYCIFHLPTMTGYLTILG